MGYKSQIQSRSGARGELWGSGSAYRHPSVASHPHKPSVLLLFSISRGTIVWNETVASKVHCLWNSGHCVYAECNSLYYCPVLDGTESLFATCSCLNIDHMGLFFHIFMTLWIHGLGLFIPAHIISAPGPWQSVIIIFFLFDDSRWLYKLALFLPILTITFLSFIESWL
jgi:hypothetical protein